MKTKMTLGVAALATGLATLSATAAGVKMAQNVTLQKGWNAVYVFVTPDESADVTFAAWPVDSVGKCNPASYLETKQFSGTGSTEGTTATGFEVWYRKDASLSQFDRVAGNNVYVCYATNAWTGTLYGAPVAPRTTWHPTSTDVPCNFVGISVVDGQTTTFDKYFSGLDIGNTSLQKVYSLGGGKTNDVSLGIVTASTPLANGFVAVMSATKVSDWSGVLNVSPQDGIDFSTDRTQASLTIRNDGATACTMRLSMTSGRAKAGETPPTVPLGLMLRDTSVYTNEWRAFNREAPFDRLLQAGEEVTLALAIDRTKLTGAAGTYYGGLLHVVDHDGGTKFRATIPIEATAAGGDAKVGAWPMGVWLASGRFTTVTSYDRTCSGQDFSSGGNMEVRLPMYVDEKGAMTLLQRFVFGADTNGTTHVYSSRKEDAFPVPIGNIKRVSSSVLPIDQPWLDAKSGGTFGSTATFDFVVGEKSRVNPMRHALHPSHDGKRWDFTTDAPSGDNLQNYISTVKPESFSITNRIVFTWNATTGKAWSPEETLSGTLQWELSGVRKEGPVRMIGTFGMKRISNVVMDK